MKFGSLEWSFALVHADKWVRVLVAAARLNNLSIALLKMQTDEHFDKSVTFESEWVMVSADGREVRILSDGHIEIKTQTFFPFDSEPRTDRIRLSEQTWDGVVRHLLTPKPGAPKRWRPPPDF